VDPDGKAESLRAALSPYDGRVIPLYV
jgi:hypothetical protein